MFKLKFQTVFSAFNMSDDWPYFLGGVEKMLTKTLSFSDLFNENDGG